MDQKAGEVLNRLLQEGIKPHARRIAELGIQGRFACVVFEPGPTAITILKAMNRHSAGPVFALSECEVAMLAASDQVAERWFSSRPNARKQEIFAFVQEGTPLINHEHRLGFSLEPGSTDQELHN